MADRFHLKVFSFYIPALDKSSRDLTEDSSRVLHACDVHVLVADSSEDSSECEEIDATQVIIHDSTPKTPMIQRRNR